ncbi:MAG: glycoside hydrolase [Notoacmeibacter sp.]|nr:glycoside hydrolase [Notoacmeibacter sp.]
MHSWTILAAAMLIAALLSAAGLAILRRTLPGSFLAAGSSSRSNHVLPARQIGGLAVIPAALAGATIAGFSPSSLLAGAILLLWVAGLADDWKPYGALARLALQFVGALLALAGTGGAPAILGFLPWPVALSVAAVFLVWCINMVNFMDGLDLMTASGAGLPLAFLATGLLASGNELSPLMAGLAGGLAGFAVHNRPPARVFLGDNGSLPLGLMAGLAILTLADTAGPLAALAPFAYYFWDSGLTILRRLRMGENILSSHSLHAYQRAFRAGFPVLRISALVAAASVLSGTMAVTAAFCEPGILQSVAGLAGLGAGLYAWLVLDRNARKPKYAS